MVNCIFEYHQDNGTIFIDGLKIDNVANLVFPDSIDGINKLAISERAFSDNKTITSVILSQSITEIGSYSFSNCESLKSISFGRNLNIKIGDLILNSCFNLEYIELDIALLKELPHMFSNESHYVGEYGKITNKQLDNGRSYSSIHSEHIDTYYDRDGDKCYRYSNTYSGYIPNKLESIGLFFGSQEFKYSFQIPSLRNFKHLKSLKYLDEVHDMRFFPRGFDVTRTENFPKEIINISSDFFKRINAGSIYISSKSGRIEERMFDDCDYEDLVFDDDVKMESWRLYNTKISGTLKTPSNITKLELNDVQINGDLELLPTIKSLVLSNFKHANPLTISDNVTNIVIISSDVKKIINNSHASSIELIACDNTHLFNLNEGVKTLIISIPMVEHKTHKVFQDIPFLPNSVETLKLDGYHLRPSLLEHSGVRNLNLTPRNEEEIVVPQIVLDNLSITAGHEAAIPLKTIDLSNVIINKKLYIGFSKSLTKVIAPLSAREVEYDRCESLSLIVVPNHVAQDSIKLNRIADRYTIVYPVTLKEYCYKKIQSLNSFNQPTKIIFKNPFIVLTTQMDREKYTYAIYRQYNLKKVVFYGKEGEKNEDLVPYWDPKDSRFNYFNIEKGKTHYKKFQKNIVDGLIATIEYPVGGLKANEQPLFSISILGNVNTNNKMRLSLRETQLDKILLTKELNNFDGVLLSESFEFDFHNVTELGFLSLEMIIDEIKPSLSKTIKRETFFIKF